MKMSILLSLENENNASVFHSYLVDIVKTSAQVRLRTKDMIFASNNVDVCPMEREKRCRRNAPIRSS